MPFLDRLNQKLDKWNAKLDQLNAQLDQQRQQQQQEQSSWPAPSPPVYPGPPPPLPPRPDLSQATAPVANTSAPPSNSGNAWQAPPPPPPFPSTSTWNSAPLPPTLAQTQSSPPPPLTAVVPTPTSVQHPSLSPGTATNAPASVQFISSTSIHITSDAEGDLEPLPILQETIETYKAIETTTPPEVTPEYHTHLKSYVDAVSKAQETASSKVEAARFLQYSQEVSSGGIDAWFKVCYNPSVEACRAGLAEMERNYWEIVKSKRDRAGEGDVHEWAQSMDMAFRNCERLRMDWDNLERERRDQESSAKSTWLYNNRHDDAVYDAVREVENAKNYQDKVIQAELSSATYARTQQYVNEIVKPFLRSFIDVCRTRRTAIGQIISTICPLLPTPPDPKDVDNVPALKPRATETFCRQLRDVANAHDVLTFRINAIHERLDALDRTLQESAQQAELDALLLQHFDPNDTWGNQSAWDARNARQNAQSEECMALVNAQCAARDARRDETQAIVKPCWDRIVKWERDRRNELMIRAAQGPGGAAFLSNMMAMQHATNMNVIGNIGSSNTRWEVKYTDQYGNVRY